MNISNLTSSEQNTLDKDLHALPWVKQVILFPFKQQLIAWLALTPAGVEIYTQQGRSALVAKLQEHCEATDFIFETQLPPEANATLGEQRLQQPLKDPLYHDYQEINGEHIWQGMVPVDLFYFKNHFHNYPLVPGVVQLRWVKEKVKQIYPHLPVIRHIHNLKFTKAIRPHTHLELKIKWNDNKKQLAFTLLSNHEVCCKGCFIY
ncbi:hypothetical protein [Psittacicella gerlachiana]|uniref:ApeI dehydratase-like domain-containing protein n=1 Tax=Psittacicella gerlachiana TaxID=2028574 RepID=A0A3A1YF17_9GAMM|nr:hypothetical protein [Psittacicella gerlachiana]RIY36833.1 hypothetical protein CKF59_02140 [Psittacicella gerlachiana]